MVDRTDLLSQITTAANSEDIALMKKVLCLVESELIGEAMAGPDAAKARETANDIIVAYFDGHGINNAKAGAFNILKWFEEAGLTVTIKASLLLYDKKTRSQRIAPIQNND